MKESEKIIKMVEKVKHQQLLVLEHQKQLFENKRITINQ